MKKLLLFTILAVSSIGLTGCNQSQKEFEQKLKNEEIENIDPFVIVYYEKSNSYKIVYHRETKVMYVISYGSYNVGTFTVLLNEEGKPLLYKGAD